MIEDWIVPEVNDEPLPQLRISASDLIDLARWHHFGETPDEEVRERLWASRIAMWVEGSSDGKNWDIAAPHILDTDVAAQIASVPTLGDATLRMFTNRKPSIVEQEHRFTKLVTHNVQVDGEWQERFVVLNGVSPTPNGQARLDMTVDPKPFPFELATRPAGRRRR